MWKKVSKYYWVKKSGRGYDELRILKQKDKYKVYYKLKGSYWALHSNHLKLKDVIKEAQRFMKYIVR